MIQVEQKETIRRLYFIKTAQCAADCQRTRILPEDDQESCKYVNNGKLSSYRQVHVISSGDVRSETLS